MVQWTSPNQMDSIYAGDNNFNNGEFGYNNMQQIVGTWTHKFNDKIYTATEAWYMYMNDAIDHPTEDVPFQSGSFPVQNGYAPEWAVVNYTMFRIARNTFFTVRNEYINDKVAAGLALPPTIRSIPSASPGGRTSSLPFVPSFAMIILTLREHITTEPGITNSSLPPT